MRVLLHACCGPCAIFPALWLGAEGFDVTLFFYNPNIFPQEERDRRRQVLGVIGTEKRWSVEYEDDPYRVFESRISEPEKPFRCRECYLMRLEKTARRAREGGFDRFSTTLLVSPYQSHEDVRRAGESAEAVTGVPFLYRDFRVGYRRGRNMARGMHVYMQKYCGCAWSCEEAAVRPVKTRGKEGP